MGAVKAGVNWYWFLGGIWWVKRNILISTNFIYSVSSSPNFKIIKVEPQPQPILFFFRVGRGYNLCLCFTGKGTTKPTKRLINLYQKFFSFYEPFPAHRVVPLNNSENPGGRKDRQSCDHGHIIGSWTRQLLIFSLDPQ